MKLFSTTNIAFLFCLSLCLSFNSSLFGQEAKFLVRDIRIIGNETTKDFVILNEIPFTVGDSVSVADLQFAQKRIYSLKIFNFVDVVSTSGNEKGKEVLILIKEGWTIFPIPYVVFQKNSIKYSTYGINFLYKNFRGRNETITANLAFGFDPNYFLSYQNPHFIKKNIKFEIALGFSNILNKSKIFKNISNEEFKYQTYYSEIIFGKRLDAFQQVNLLVDFRSISLDKAYAPEYLSSKSSQDLIPQVGISYKYDSRNLSLYASKGNYIEAGLSYLGFGIDNINYSSAIIDMRKYLRIYDIINLKIGLFNRSLIGSQIPIYDLSYLGYLDYIRGNSKLVQQGKNKIKGILEIGLPIVKDYDLSLVLPLLPRELTSSRIGIHLISFYDIGKTYNSFRDLTDIPNQFIRGYGFGLNILFLPYNVLRFVYGFSPYNENGEFIFETGFSF